SVPTVRDIGDDLVGPPASLQGDQGRRPSGRDRLRERPRGVAARQGSGNGRGGRAVALEPVPEIATRSRGRAHRSLISETQGRVSQLPTTSRQMAVTSNGEVNCFSNLYVAHLVL